MHHNLQYINNSCQHSKKFVLKFLVILYDLVRSVKIISEEFYNIVLI